MSKRTVALIFGGKSTEHEISVISARAVAAQIDRERFSLRPVYIGHDGRWYGGTPAEAALDLDMSALLRRGTVESARRSLREITGRAAGDRFDFSGFRETTDVAFIALHGSYGEDGTIQGFLDTLGIPYTGCGVTASALAMDKALTKLCAASAGLAVADYLVVSSADFLSDPQKAVSSVCERFAFPVFVKPACLGSSVGIAKVHHVGELLQALEDACRQDKKVLVETAVTGREIEVAVLGNDSPVASLPGEIIPGNEFYDYEDKYITSAARLCIPADLSPRDQETVMSSAIVAFRALGCRGMSRIDFFLENGTGRVILNEINTIPGFTDISMYPRLMAASGIGFVELVEKLLALALEKTGPIDKL
jgi:D-alanine-D-alanine ligase